MKCLLLFVCLLPGTFSFTQQINEDFDYNFKPSNKIPRYIVISQKQGALWHREAYYWPEQTMAMEGWYLDDSCAIATDTCKWFHTSGYLQSIGRYVSGKKDGVWLSYNEDGSLIDSATYADGHLIGVEQKWHSNGMPSDSLQFDGKGNGVQVSWYDDGYIAAAGYWEKDTLKRARWQYFSDGGKLIATEDYIDGKKIACKCFDASGIELDSSLCREKEAAPEGGINLWIDFIVQNLRTNELLKKGIAKGDYTILIRFSIDENGNISDVTSLTNYGLEQEVIRVMKQSSKWNPAEKFGRKIKSYHTQPITLSFPLK